MTNSTLPHVLPHQLNRRIVIRAAPDVVFEFFTDSSRWAQWWGAGSRIDARPGGEVHIRYPEGTEVSGEVLEVSAPTRLVFSYGYVSGQMIPPGGSRVTIALSAAAEGTQLELTHEFADEPARDAHVQGWRYQLSLFSTLVSDWVNRNAAAAVDAWFDVWADVDAESRTRTLAGIADSHVRFRDRFGNIDGIDDLVPHIAGAQQFMPGITLRRVGDVRHCQGTVLAEWAARSADGKEVGRGTNVFQLGPTGRIESVTGFWA